MRQEVEHSKRTPRGTIGWRVVATLCLALLFVGCSRREQETTAREAASGSEPNTQAKAAAQASTTDTNRQVFEVRGVVEEVKPAESEVVVKHERVVNPDGSEYMPAMTMSLEVKDTNELMGLAPNDQISFKMIVTEDEGWIEQIQKLGVDRNSLGGRPKARVVRDVEPLAVGDKMPNYTFTNSLGEKVSLSDFAGQAYAFTFIFTRCPFPNFCPRMNTNFAEAYEQLKGMPNAPTNWHLISISFDPDFDTPQRLRDYAARYNPDPKKWSWVTGALIDIDAITEQVGLVFAPEAGSIIAHTLRTVVIDKNGVIRQNFWGNEWKVEDLVKEIVAGAQGKPVGEN